MAEQIADALRLRKICSSEARATKKCEGEDPYITEMSDYLLTKTRYTRKTSDNFNPKTGQGGRRSTNCHITTRTKPTSIRDDETEKACDKLESALAEFMNIMEDGNKLRLRPKNMLRHDDSIEKAKAWAEEFNEYFE